MRNYSCLGERLLKKREEQKLPLVKTAQSLGISPSNLSAYEKNASMPSAYTLHKIGQFYHTTVDWLLTGMGEEYISKEFQIDRLASMKMEDDPHLYMTMALRLMMEESPERASWVTCQFRDAFDKHLSQLLSKSEIK